MSKIQQLRQKILDYYDKIPRQYQLYTGEISLALDDMIREWASENDRANNAEFQLNSTIKQRDKLHKQFTELENSYDKLNRKLNSGLVDKKKLLKEK